MVGYGKQKETNQERKFMSNECMSSLVCPSSPAGVTTSHSPNSGSLSERIKSRGSFSTLFCQNCLFNVLLAWIHPPSIRGSRPISRKSPLHSERTAQRHAQAPPAAPAALLAPAAPACSPPRSLASETAAETPPVRVSSERLAGSLGCAAGMWFSTWVGGSLESTPFFGGLGNSLGACFKGQPKENHNLGGPPHGDMQGTWLVLVCLNHVGLAQEPKQRFAYGCTRRFHVGESNLASAPRPSWARCCSTIHAGSRPKSVDTPKAPASHRSAEDGLTP